MNPNSTPPRSFNTVRQSHRKERVKRIQKSRMALLGICAVAVLMMLTLAVFLFCTIMHAVNAGKEPNDGQTPGGNVPPAGSILYQQISYENTKKHTGSLIVVNASHEYVFPKDTSHLLNMMSSISKNEVGGNNCVFNNSSLKMEKEAFAQFDLMVKKYVEVEGECDLLVASAYRTRAEQEALNNNTAPGHSDYHTGLSLELKRAIRNGEGSTFSGNQRLDPNGWVYLNAHKYGFVSRYPATESAEAITGILDYTYSFRYVGVAHATYMYENKLCLEEYITLLQNNYAGGQNLTVNGADGNRYEVYYVAAGEGELSTIKVPSNYDYTISGDNMGGFIVTVNMNSPKTAA